MYVFESKGDGYIPTYIRTNLTEINTYKNFKKIFEQIK